MPTPTPLFDDRRHAGLALARVLAQLDLERPVVLALPRGGVPVGFEIAAALGAPLDVLIVRKLGVPGHEELALGAIASPGDEGVTGGPGEAGPIRVLNREVIDALALDDDLIDRVAAREQRELDRRERLYRGSRSPIPVAGRPVILVDDGLATGATMRAAVSALRHRRPASIIVAVPVGAASSCVSVGRVADQLVCLAQPEPFYGVGLWYRAFDQTRDDEVRRLLAANAQIRSSTRARPGPHAAHREVAIVTPDATLDGLLDVPAEAVGLVLFAHGSGSSRHSPRNRYVAQVLNEAKVATLLFDLLTRDEGERDAFDRGLRFDIELLARRVIGAVDWVGEQAEIAALGLGLFGASTGAAAALVAAAARPERVAAVVSRGGRPDLAGDALLAVRAPTLLVVGARDTEVVALNERAQARIQAPVELRLIPGATHLFEEPGALDAAAAAAAEFFHDRLCHARGMPG